MSDVLSRRAFLFLSSQLAVLTAVGWMSCLSRAQAASLRKLAPAERALINRMTWGVDAALMQTYFGGGRKAFIESLFQAGPATLPAPVQARIDKMTLSVRSPEELIHGIRKRQKAIRTASDEKTQRTARETLQIFLNRLHSESMERSVLRLLYSPYQFQERLTWFWCNHFNLSVHQSPNMRALVSDFEEKAIRPNVFGNFEDLLMATVRHPAMLVYLDNIQNHAGRINENYGRELLELHTLGVGGGYTQSDVRNLSRILTGLGINTARGEREIEEEYRDAYVRAGLFEFNPALHDHGDKELLGHKIAVGGLDEVVRMVRLLARHPSTARHLSGRLAMYFVSDTPPNALVDAMATSYLESRGDLSVVLRTMLEHDAFRSSLRKDDFKDPLRYVLSGIRLLYPLADGPVVNARQIVRWLKILGQQPFMRQTPDGYPIRRADWQGSAQMAARFDVARQMAAGPVQLFYSGTPPKGARRRVSRCGRALYEHMEARDVRPATREALAKARNLREWNELWLSSPDFMYA